MTTKTTLNKLPYLLFLILINLYSHAQTPSWQWAKRVGSFNDNAPFTSGDQNERFNDIKVDSLGNVYAVGEFFQNSAFDNQATGFPTTGGYGEHDAYLVKISKCGKTLWWRRMGGVNRDAAKSLVLDNAGKVIVLGGSGSTTYTVGDGVHDTTINSNGNIVFLAKFDTAGNFMNVLNTYTGFPNFFGANFITRLFIDNQNNYFISDGNQAVRVNTLGVTMNFYNYTATSGNIPKIRGLALDKNNNIYMSGFFTGTLTIGGATVTTTNVPPGGANSLIYKFSPTGSLLWLNTSNPSSGSNGLYTCTLDTSNTILITGGGAVLGTTVFGYTVSPPATGNANVFYCFSANTGSLISALTATTQYVDLITPIYTDSNNKIHCAGTIGGQLAFNTATYTSNPLTGTRQGCIGIYDIISNTVSVKMLPQTGSSASTVREAINSMTADNQGNIYIAGMFGGTLDSLGTPVNIIGGNEDGFIAKFGYPCGSTPTGSVPNVPMALTAINNSLTNNVAWTDNSSNEDNFELHYTIGSNPTYSLLATLPANTTSYAHTGLTHTTTYCYKVAATNTIGSSAFSNTDCATTPAAPTNTAQAPNAPLNLTATNNGSLTNNVAWTDNSSDETNFDLHYKSGSSTTYSLLVTLPANTTTYPHTGLSYTTSYCYKVVATNSVGSSAFSNTSCATTPTDGTTTGITKNTANAINVLCYPNPASIEIYFDVPNTEKQIDLDIYNALGSLVLSKKNYTNNSVISISELSRGLYYYKLKTAKNEYVGKVVKER